MNFRTGNEAREEIIQLREVAFDRNLKCCDLIAFFIDKDDIGLAAVLADQICPSCALHYRIDLLRIRHHHVAHLARKLNDH